MSHLDPDEPWAFVGGQHSPSWKSPMRLGFIRESNRLQRLPLLTGVAREGWVGERGIGCDQAKKGRWELGARAEQERRGCSWREARGCRGGRKQEDGDMKGRVVGLERWREGARCRGDRRPAIEGLVDMVRFWDSVLKILIDFF